MTLEQAITIKTLADWHSLGHVVITSLEDDGYKIAGLQMQSNSGKVLKFKQSGKSFIQAYTFINTAIR